MIYQWRSVGRASVPVPDAARRARLGAPPACPARPPPLGLCWDTAAALWGSWGLTPPPARAAGALRSLLLRLDFTFRRAEERSYRSADGSAAGGAAFPPA